MRNIAKRSVALLLFVAMVLSVCQGVVVPTFAGDTAGSTVSTVATDPPDSGGGAEETSTVATERVDDETENSSTEVSEPTEVTEPVEDTTNPSVPDESLGTDEPSEEGTEQTEPVTNPSEPESGESSEGSETTADGDDSGFWLDVGDILVPTIEEDSGSVSLYTLPGGTNLSISRKDYYTPFPGGVKFYFVSDISGTNGGWNAFSQSIFHLSDGRVAFCMHPMMEGGGSYEATSPGDTYIGSDGWPTAIYYSSKGYWVSFSFDDTAKKGAFLVMAYGAPNNGDTSDAGIRATAICMWDMITGHRNLDGTPRNGGAPFYDALTDSAIKAKYDQILAKMAKYGKIPSFSVKTSSQISSASTITLKRDSNTGLYTASVTDKNGVLSSFNFVSTVSGLTFSKSGNTLKITATEAAAQKINGLIVKSRGYNLGEGKKACTVYQDKYNPASRQKLVALDGKLDPIPCLFKIAVKPDAQPFTLQKRCNTSCSGQLSGNPMYSLAGAKYEIYVNGKLSETLTTDAKGNATSSKKYSSGTKITVKEVKASPGYVITQPNPNTFTITSTASKNVFTVYENPTFDPVSMRFTKVDPSTTTAQGSTSFEGAIFKIDYYANTNWSGNPTRTWYFRTNEGGYFNYNPNYLAPGYTSDSLYSDRYGGNQFPLGSIKVTEIVAPYGYTLMPTLYATITQPSNGANGFFEWTAESQAIVDGGNGVYTGKEPQDTSTFGRFTVQKVDSQTGSNPQGGVANLSAKFQVINRSANSVKIGDNAVAASGAVCYEFWTDASGNFTSEYIFPMGTYEIKEVTPPEGMLLNSTWSKTFTVTKSNKDFSFTGVNACSNGIIRGDVVLHKYDRLLGEDTPENVKFEGVTFSIYNDNENPVVVDGVTYNKGDVVVTIPIVWDASEQAWVAKTTGQLLPYGTYTIKENTRKEGSGYANDYYFLCHGSQTFSIRTNGEIVTTNTDGSAIKFENEPIARIEVHKVNTAGEPLKGVKFLLEWSQDGDSWFPIEYLDAEGLMTGATTSPGLVDGCLVTDENGYLAFEGLDPYSYYRLTEVETLDGYQLLKDPVFVGTLERNSETIVEYSGRVVNVESFTLPKTGAKDMSFLSFALAICVTISFGALVYCKKKEKV